MVFGQYLGDMPLPYVRSSASNHTKLVRRGDILNKKILMYMPHVYATKGYPERLPANLEGDQEWGCDLLTDWMRLLRVGEILSAE